ncbi:ArgS-related anticodon-binding protein NrtL [Streptomyces sp. NPDC003077]|uniref:ArgS-related anticodon-binding protein NrtL n=1 Tax=Streptomyces sp. NPDC003077 TaxID=3154443 RepID=UPI0033B2E1D3
MTPAELSCAVLRAVRGAVEDGELSVTVPERVVVRPPSLGGVGDYASNVALRLAGPAGRAPGEVAEILRRRLEGVAGIGRVEVAGPGFLNFTLGAGASVAGLVRMVLGEGAAYGGDGRDVPPLRGKGEPRAVVEEPRGVIVGEALGRIFRAVGAEETPERPVVRPLESGLTLEGLRARLGEDELRWAVLRTAAHDRVRLPERPVQREGNPRFAVQYAHARARAVVRNAGELGIAGEAGDPGFVAGEPSKTSKTSGRPDGLASSAADQHVAVGDRRAPGPDRPAPGPALCAALASYPAVVQAAARHRAPERVARHVEDTAEAFFRCVDAYPPLPVGEEKPLAVHRARVALAEATGTVLANGLRLLGISAPERL